jgi:hypothetical protein
VIGVPLTRFGSLEEQSLLLALDFTGAVAEITVTSTDR